MDLVGCGHSMVIVVVWTSAWLWYHLLQSKPTASTYSHLLTFSSWLPLKVCKTRLLGRGFKHPYKECFVSLSNQCGISQSTPLEAQCPRWHTVQCLALLPFVTVTSKCCLLWAFSFVLPLKVFKNAYVRERFPHPYKQCFVTSQINVGSYNPSPRSQCHRWHSALCLALISFVTVQTHH